MCYFILWRDTTSELWTPVLFPLYCYHLFTLLALFTLIAYYYYFPLDTLIPLFQANRWDWQPHRKLGAKYLVMLCAGSTLPLAKQSLDEAPYKLSGAIAKLAGITFLSLAFSWIRLNLGFLPRENLVLYSSYLPLGVPNWTVKNHQHRATSVCHSAKPYTFTWCLI
jgi:hypothetical protein